MFMMSRTAMFVAILAMVAIAGAGAQSQGPDMATLEVQFDNRGSKVEGKSRELIAAVAKILQVPASQVSMNAIGQSTLLNHQSVASFSALGPTANGKPVYVNCMEAVKNGWFTKSEVAKDLHKATESLWPGQSVKVQKATCGAPGVKPSGRKML